MDDKFMNRPKTRSMGAINLIWSYIIMSEYESDGLGIKYLCKYRLDGSFWMRCSILNPSNVAISILDILDRAESRLVESFQHLRLGYTHCIQEGGLGNGKHSISRAVAPCENSGRVMNTNYIHQDILIREVVGVISTSICKIFSRTTIDKWIYDASILVLS